MAYRSKRYAAAKKVNNRSPKAQAAVYRWLHEAGSRTAARSQRAPAILESVY
ncbi:MAG: hypothetical protein R3E79_22940 [Caldilineaceae bacterium]